MSGKAVSMDLVSNKKPKATKGNHQKVITYIKKINSDSWELINQDLRRMLEEKNREISQLRRELNQKTNELDQFKAMLMQQRIHTFIPDEVSGIESMEEENN